HPGAVARHQGHLAHGAAERAGHVVVRAELQPSEDAAAIVVEDDGPGVAEEARERIFDPYFTSKRQGTGLGLAIVKKIVVEHNGSIAARRSTRLGGAGFALVLPVVAPDPPLAPVDGRRPGAEPAPPPSRRSLA